MRRSLAFVVKSQAYTTLVDHRRPAHSVVVMANHYGLWQMRTRPGRELPTTEAPLGRVLVDGQLEGRGWNEALKNVRLVLHAADREAARLLREWATAGAPVNLGLTCGRSTYSLEGVKFDDELPSEGDLASYRAIAGLICTLTFHGEKEWPRDVRAEDDGPDPMKQLYAYGALDNDDDDDDDV